MATRKSSEAPKKTSRKKPPIKGKRAAPRTKPQRGSSAEAEHRAHTPKAARSTRAPATTDAQAPERPLTPKEALFVAEYLIDLNATQAYLRSHPGVKHSTANVEGCRLLANPCVQAAVASGARKTADKLELTRERVLLETARLAFFDPRKMLHPDGRPKHLHELDDDTAAAIAGLEIVEERDHEGKVIGHVKKYKVAEKNPSLERAARILALFKDDNDQKTKPAADVLREFLGHLHGGAARLQVVPPKGGQPAGPGLDGLVKG